MTVDSFWMAMYTMVSIMQNDRLKLFSAKLSSALCPLWRETRKRSCLAEGRKWDWRACWVGIQGVSQEEEWQKMDKISKKKGMGWKGGNEWRGQMVYRAERSFHYKGSELGMGTGTHWREGLFHALSNIKPAWLTLSYEQVPRFKAFTC